MKECYVVEELAYNEDLCGSGEHFESREICGVFMTEESATVFVEEKYSNLGYPMHWKDRSYCGKRTNSDGKEEGVRCDIVTSVIFTEGQTEQTVLDLLKRELFDEDERRKGMGSGQWEWEETSSQTCFDGNSKNSRQPNEIWSW